MSPPVKHKPSERFSFCRNETDRRNDRREIFLVPLEIPSIRKNRVFRRSKETREIHCLVYTASAGLGLNVRQMPDRPDTLRGHLNNETTVRFPFDRTRDRSDEFFRVTTPRKPRIPPNDRTREMDRLRRNNAHGASRVCRPIGRASVRVKRREKTRALFTPLTRVNVSLCEHGRGSRQRSINGGGGGGAWP